MEFTEYLAVLRRHWRIWVGCTAVALLLAAVVLETTPRTYEATARVFVSASPSISNSAQFVNQRAKSYPAVAVSEAVLGPVIERLGLDLTSAELRSRVTADNPVDTSQVQVTTSGLDPDEVAAISNAVAEELADVVEELETPASGNRPVTLTVNDPATAPTRAVTPVPLYVLGLGLIAGLFVGLAAAVLRSRLATRLYSEAEVRTAWGTDEDIDLLAPRRGRARQSALTGRPAAALARRLELAGEDRPIRVAILSPSPDELRAARALAEEVAVELRGREMPTTVTGPGLAGAPLLDERPHVRLEVTDPLAPLRFWRDVASRYDGVVVVLPRGRVDEAELREVRGILRTAGIAPLAVVLTGRPRRPLGQTGENAAPAPAATTATPASRPTVAPTATVRRADESVVAANGVPINGNGARPDVPDTKHKGTADQRRSR
jgi:capsular polysaccharide biosynthesis protein